MKDKISLAGDLGSGKSTISDILLARLGAEYYSTGAIVRQIASRRGMTVGELNTYMETHPEIDREIDDGLVALSDIDRCLVIDSRMAWHFTRDTFRVYLSTDAEVSAARIMNAGRASEPFRSLEEAVAGVRARRASEKRRYWEQYGVDIKDLSNYTLVVDTTEASPQEVAECILSSLERWHQDPSFRCAYLSSQRLALPDRPADEQQVQARCAALERGETIPAVQAVHEDERFYLVEGLESALAYALYGATFIPAELVSAPITGEYVTVSPTL